MADKILVFVTCSSRKEARKIAQELVKRRLAACVNESGGALTSIYRWKGKIERAKEFLLMIKTTKKQFGKLCAAVQELHSYDVPEVIALPIVEGSARYLEWIAESVR
jgi:periplasmic divalent cation tolerance protein